MGIILSVPCSSVLTTVFSCARAILTSFITPKPNCARRAAAAYSPEFLWRCTLVTTFEPCAMCTGTLYWVNIGRLVYGASEETLLALTGDSAANPTLQLDSRTVLGSGQKQIQVHGPFADMEEELTALHRDFWKAAPKA